MCPHCETENNLNKNDVCWNCRTEFADDDLMDKAYYIRKLSYKIPITNEKHLTHAEPDPPIGSGKSGANFQIKL